MALQVKKKVLADSLTSVEAVNAAELSVIFNLTKNIFTETLKKCLGCDENGLENLKQDNYCNNEGVSMFRK